MLLGIGLVMFGLGLICQLKPDWGLCLVELVPFPNPVQGGQLVSDAFIRVNLPLGMVIIGIGLQLYSKMGWITSVAILFAFWIVFGVSVVLHWPHFMAEGMDYFFVKAVILHLVFMGLILGGIMLLFSPGIRRMYWKRAAQPEGDANYQ